ncbi:MAG: hypothetical protein HWN80_18315 [Candidatus Lokiarchaeota archaeon]|nr:hypothetical protein [Candidatus Lokiarchaeota archaeon]
MVAEPYSGFAQRYNMILGILISAFSTNILFLIIPIGLFFMADIFLIVGSCFGLYFTFRYRKESQSHIKTGMIVGLVSSILSLFLISCFDWIFYFIPGGYGFDFLLFLEYTLYLFMYFGIFYVTVGLILGYFFGYIYRKKEDTNYKSSQF